MRNELQLPGNMVIYLDYMPEEGWAAVRNMLIAIGTGYDITRFQTPGWSAGGRFRMRLVEGNDTTVYHVEGKTIEQLCGNAVRQVLEDRRKRDAR